MKCPICKTTELTEHKLNGVTLHTCSSCRGFWLTKSEMEGIKDKIPYEAWFDLDLWSEKEKLVAKKSSSVCPVDQTPLSSLDWDNSHITLKICGKCGGIWLDHGEMKKVIDYIEHEADSDLMTKYWTVLKEKVGEVFTGHEGLGHEIHSVWTVLNMLEYKMMAQNPSMTNALMALNNLSVELPGA